MNTTKATTLLFLFLVKTLLIAQEAEDSEDEFFPSIDVTNAIQRLNHQPDLYTGTNAISIPLTSIQTGYNSSLDINLNYRSKGVKIAETAGWVGVDWSITDFGVISISKQGGSHIYSVNFSVPGYSGKFEVDWVAHSAEALNNSATIENIVVEYGEVTLSLPPSVFGYTILPYTNYEQANRDFSIKTPTHNVYFSHSDSDIQTWEAVHEGSGVSIPDFSFHGVPSNAEVPLFNEYGAENSTKKPSAFYPTKIEHLNSKSPVYLEYDQLLVEAPKIIIPSPSVTSDVVNNNGLFIYHGKLQGSPHAFIKPILKRIYTDTDLVEFETEEVLDGITTYGRLLKKIIHSKNHETIEGLNYQDGSRKYTREREAYPIKIYQFDYEMHDGVSPNLGVMVGANSIENDLFNLAKDYAELTKRRPFLSAIEEITKDEQKASFRHTMDYYDPTKLTYHSRYHSPEVSPFGHLWKPSNADDHELMSYLYFYLSSDYGIDFNDNIKGADLVINDLGELMFDVYWNYRFGHNPYNKEVLDKIWLFTDGMESYNLPNRTTREENPIVLDGEYNVSIPDFSELHFGMLKTLTYPQGNSIEFEYENRSYGALLSNKTTKHTDGSIKKSTDYTYEESALPLGYLKTSVFPSTTSNSQGNITHHHWAASFNGPIVYTDPVGHGIVREKIQGGSEVVRYYTTAKDYDNIREKRLNPVGKYVYTDFLDIWLKKAVREEINNDSYFGNDVDGNMNSIGSVFDPLPIGHVVSMQEKRGLLKRIEYKNSQGELLSSTDQIYDFFEYDKVLTSSIVVSHLDYWRAFISFVNQPLIHPRIKTSIETRYFPKKNQEIIVEDNTYYYDNDVFFKLATRVETIRPDGAQISKVYTGSNYAVSSETKYTNGVFNYRKEYSDFINLKAVSNGIDYGNGYIDLKKADFNNIGLLRYYPSSMTVRSPGKGMDITTYAYDERQNVIETRNAAGVTKINYDERDRPIETLKDEVHTYYEYDDDFGMPIRLKDDDENIVRQQEFNIRKTPIITLDGPDKLCDNEYGSFTIAVSGENDTGVTPIDFFSINYHNLINNSINNVFDGSSSRTFNFKMDGSETKELEVTAYDSQGNYLSSDSEIINPLELNWSVNVESGGFTVIQEPIDSDCFYTVDDEDIVLQTIWLEYSEDEFITDDPDMPWYDDDDDFKRSHYGYNKVFLEKVNRLGNIHEYNSNGIRYVSMFYFNSESDLVDYYFDLKDEGRGRIILHLETVTIDGLSHHFKQEIE